MCMCGCPEACPEACPAPACLRACQAAQVNLAQKEAQTLTEDFNHVWQQRFDTFTQAFEHIATQIDVIYKVGEGAQGIVRGGGSAA